MKTRTSSTRNRPHFEVPVEQSKDWLAWSLGPILVSGSVLKPMGISSIFDVDITVASVAFLVGAALWGLVHGGRFPVRSLVPYFLIWLVVLFGVSMSESGAYQAQKTRDFFLLTGVVVLAGSVVINGRSGMRSLVSLWISVGALAAGNVLLVGGSESLSGRFGIDDATLGPAYLSASGLVAVVAAWNQRLLTWKFAIPVTVLTSIALVGIGSRGPLLSAFVGFAAWLLLGTRLTLRALTICVVFVVAILVGLRNAPDVALSRVFRYEDFGRERLWEVARIAFLDHPLRGVGWGNYAELAWAKYPHNLFLENAAELGVLGLIALSVLLVAVAFNTWRYRKTSEVRILGSVAIVAITGQQFSSDMSNRFFWIGLLPMLLVGGSKGETANLLSKPFSNEFASATRGL